MECPIIFISVVLLISLIPISYEYAQLSQPVNFNGTPINLGSGVTDFDSKKAFSIKFSMIRGSSISNECLICKTPPTSFYLQGWDVWTDGQLLIIQLNGKNADDINYLDMIRVRSSIFLDNNKPQDILITYNGNATAKGLSLMVNGTKTGLQVLSDNLVNPINNSRNAYAGSMSDGNSYKFTGTISNLIFYSGIYANGGGQNYSLPLNDGVHISDFVSSSITMAQVSQPQTVMNESPVNGVVQCPSNYKLVGMITTNNTGICQYDDPELKFIRYDNYAAYMGGKINEYQFGGDINNKTGEFYPDFNGIRGDKMWNPINNSWTGYPADIDWVVMAKAGFTSCYRLGDGGLYSYSICKRPGQGLLELVHHTFINGPAITDLTLDPVTGRVNVLRGDVNVLNGSLNVFGHIYANGGQLVK